MNARADARRRSTWPATLTVIASIIAVVFLFGPHSCPGEAEIARRASCKSKLRHIYSALVDYRENTSRLPDSLDDLVTRGLLTPSDLTCPSSIRSSREGRGTPYQYHPEAWGDPNRPVVTEALGNHPGTAGSSGCEFVSVGPARHALYSDGTVRDSPN
jgi:hypothetical protein